MDNKEIKDMIKKEMDSIVVPDSVKPENMRKLLDEKQIQMQKNNKSDKKIKLVRFTKYATSVAAAVAIVLVSVTVIKNQTNNSGSDIAASSVPTTTKTVDYVTGENAPNGVDNANNTDEILEGIGLKPISGYTDFADKIKSNAYINRYDVEYDDAIAEAPEASFDSNSAVNGSSVSKNDTSTEHSNTNVRTEGIDEADCIKTNGKYICALSNGDTNGIISVYSAAGKDSKLLCKLDFARVIKAQATRIYKDNQKYERELPGYNHYYSRYSFAEQIRDAIIGREDISYNYYRQEMYLTDKQVILVGELFGTTVVLTYDLSNINEDMDGSKIMLGEKDMAGTSYIDGSYNSSRLVNDELYLITNKSLRLSSNRYYVIEDYAVDMNTVDVVPAEAGSSVKKETESETEVGTEPEAQTEKKVTEEEMKNKYAVLVNGKVLECKNAFGSCQDKYDSSIALSCIKLSKPNEFSSVKAMYYSGYGNLTVYMSADHIYTFMQVDESEEQSKDNTYTSNSTSQVSSFAFKDGKLIPIATTNIKGYIKDTFDVDEYNGNLRVAASLRMSIYRRVNGYGDTVYNAPGDDEEQTDVYYSEYVDSRIGSAIYVLNDKLEIVGSIDNLSEDERVYGVRYDGDIAYVVTYRETDPLFTIDFSDPKNPKILGELKIPGFSEYLHKWDDSKLVGIGQDENGDIKISTYDISDRTNVVEKDIVRLGDVVGADYAWSDAFSNYKSIFIEPEKNLIGIPVESYDNDQVYEYVLFSYKNGELTKVLGQEFDCEYNSSMRALYVGNDLYLVSTNNEMAVYDLATFDAVATVK